MGTSDRSRPDRVFRLGVAEDYEQLVEDIVRDGRLYASENHQEILKVSASRPGPRCPGLRGMQEHPSRRLCPRARPALVASVRSHRGGEHRVGW